MSEARALLVFLDGVGVGPPDPAINPIAAARLPTISRLLGSAPVAGVRPRITPRAGWVPADATMGVAGLPRSGTGQTALLTGVNAAELYGRHFGPWIPTALREMLARDNLLSRAAAAGRRVDFANATPPAQTQAASGRWRRPAGPPLAAAGAGLRLRDARDLARGEALASSITTERWRELDPALPDPAPAEAGRTLARIAAAAHLTLFAHYDTDFVGHRGDRQAAIGTLERIDDFLAGLLDALGDDTLLVVASDHGNVEDLRGGHTTNPVPVIAAGPHAGAFVGRVRAITDVSPALLSLLGIEGSGSGRD